MLEEVIVIAGPTASGKSELAVGIAEALGAEVLSADSRQVYRELNAGVAKPTADQLARVRHHLVSYVSIHDDYSAGRWARDARAALDELPMRCAVIVGGAGLHVRALLEGLPEMPRVSAEQRARYEQLFVREGIAPLRRLLRERDPAYAAEVDLDNAHRLQRALAVMDAAGERFSVLRARPASPLPYRQRWIILDPARADLHERIASRVDGMIAAGLEAEARSLAPSRHLDALRTIGYREWWTYFDEGGDVAEVVRRIKAATRQYARRQRTWNRKLRGDRLAAPDLDAALQILSAGG